MENSWSIHLSMVFDNMCLFLKFKEGLLKKKFKDSKQKVF